MIHAFQWDLARQVERLDWLLEQLPRYAEWGYQELYLHLEDAVDYPSLPGVARADAYSWREFERLVETAQRHGIGVVPIANLLGHTQYLVKTDEWRDLNELRAPDGSPLDRGQICPLHPRTPEVAERLLRDLAPYCNTGKIHVGLDESFHLGRHPLSRREIEHVGLAGHFARYVARLHALARGHGLRLGLWADMLALLPEAIDQLPRDVIAYDWYYHAFRRHPRVELYNFAEVDVATPLRARGIEYWGCPMNGAFRFEPLPVFGERLANAQSWWRRCREVGAGGFLVTSWEANRLAVETTTVVDAAIASLWLHPEVEDHVSLLEKGWQRVYGLSSSSARAAARVALAADTIAFAGYARWEINDRWDVVPRRDSLAHVEAEVRRARRLMKRPALPAALGSSLQFRWYLAERDAFLRRAVRGVDRLRRARNPEQRSKLLAHLREDTIAFASILKQGRAAAQAMWRQTRDPQQTGPNERILELDAQRLQHWRRWLTRCSRRPEAANAGSPVAAAWRVELTVINFAPAVQRVSIEQLGTDGSWRELHGRFTIEFRTPAARPQANLRREFVAPLEDPSRALRIVVRGIGEVALSQVQLTNGVEYRRARGPAGRPRGRLQLGRPAPTKGWPELDLSRPSAIHGLEFDA